MKARDAAQRALELEPDLAEAHDALGRIQLWHDWDWVAAEASYHRALDLAPADVDLMRSRSWLLANLGRLHEATELIQRALTFDPLNAGAYRSLTLVHTRAGDIAGAELAAKKAIELNPKATFTHWWMGIVCLMQGRLDEALKEIEQEEGSVFRLQALAIVHHARGSAAESDAALRRLIDIGSEGSAFQIAEAYAYRGNTDPAFEWLERAYVQRDTGIPFTKTSLFLTNIHGDPRWRPFLEKLRFPD